MIEYFKTDYKSMDFLKNKLYSIYNYKDVGTAILHINRVILFIDIIKKLDKNSTFLSKKRALDIGCSAGVYSKIISDIGFQEVIGIDIDKKGIDKARKNFQNDKIKFYISNAENSKNETFDLILCTEVIEHTKNPMRVIDNIIEWLKPGGIGIISLPNKMSLPFLVEYAKLKIRRIKFSSEFKEHLNYPYYRSYKMFSSHTNVKIIQTTGTGLILHSLLIKTLQKTKLFKILNKIDSKLSRKWYFKNFTQFFFIVFIKK